MKIGKISFNLQICMIAILSPITAGSPSDFRFIYKLIKTDKDQMTATHNHYRRLVKNPSAADMKAVTWDEELAQFANRTVRSCNFKHNSPAHLKTKSYPKIGENLYAGGDYLFRTVMTTDGVAKLWHSEVSNYNYAKGNCQAGKQCGHYTQMVWAETDKIGCAIANCRKVDGGLGPMLIACNYAPGGNTRDSNGLARRPYKSGVACSQCSGGGNCVDKLCSREKSAKSEKSANLVKKAAGSVVATTSMTTAGEKKFAQNDTGILLVVLFLSVWYIAKFYEN